ncbi:hypothetical protein HSX11_16780 [Oxalobacteraceae bacterium]|nr:hypothetical protein [Oxalobacteraceae bacterium]
MNADLAAIEASILELKMLLSEIKTLMSEIKTSISNLKITVIVTGISVVLATVFGVAVFNATVLSNKFASFESGKNTSAAQAEFRRQTAEIDVQIMKTQVRLDAIRAKDSDKHESLSPLH